MILLAFRGSRFIAQNYSRPGDAVECQPGTVVEKPDVGSVIRLSELWDVNEDMYDRLKELELKVVPYGNMSNYAEVVPYGSMQCFKCGCWYLPGQREVDRFAENDCIMEPTDWECPTCRRAEREIPVGADEPDYVQHNYCQIHGVYHSCSLNWPA